MKLKLILLPIILGICFSYAKGERLVSLVDAPKRSNTENLDPLENIYNNYEWVSKIRTDHPRLFFNKESFGDVKNSALNEENQVFQDIKSSVDKLLNKEIVFEKPLTADASYTNDSELATRAAEATFVFLITEDQKYFELSKNILKKVVEYYELRNSNKLNISWYSYSRIHALIAYNWLYNHLSDADRRSIGLPLFNAIEYMLPSTERKNFHRENREGIDAGFYNNQSLEWYLGLTFYKTGINDFRAEKYLKKGYDSQKTVLTYRKDASGDDGGAASGTLQYAFLDYPWAEYNFFQTFISATGYNIAAQYDYLPNFVNYLYWNTLPQQREFGFGDTRHLTNSIAYPILNLFLSQQIHFYGDRFPLHVAVAKWMMETKYPRKSDEQNDFPMARFFITNKKTAIDPLDPTSKMPKGRYFESMGQVFMRSGSGDDDTYATFTASTNLLKHKHYDNNNFLIYKKGYGCLDTGTRPQPGIHLSHYFPRTIAHNCITIRMPGETLPKYWGDRAAHEANDPIPNDGGQNSLTGTEVVAFDENEHYVYIASDATQSYNSLKTNQVLRQFVFLPPNNFIVFDRVNATNATYSKKWLLHTAEQPKVSSDKDFYSLHEGGRLICKTIYPENSTLELIGGPNKQFWSDYKNWALPNGGDNHQLYGQWRVEISPTNASKDDIFLHLIQVDDRLSKVQTITSAEKTEELGMKGVTFTYDNKEYKVLFSTSGPAAGKIAIVSKGQTILNENFTNVVKQQSGLAFTTTVDITAHKYTNKYISFHQKKIYNPENLPLEVFNVSGQMLISSNASNINVQHLKPGVYIVHDKKLRNTLKIMK